MPIPTLSPHSPPHPPVHTKSVSIPTLTPHCATSLSPSPVPTLCPPVNRAAKVSTFEIYHSTLAAVHPTPRETRRIVVISPLCDGYDYDSTSIRWEFDCFSKFIKVTVTGAAYPLVAVTLTYLFI